MKKTKPRFGGDMGSSSRRKPLKKKSTKLSSRAWKMKKSRTKSRKLGRRHDSSTDDSMNSTSYSSNSDDDSISSKSFSTSSSKDTCRRRSSVSRSRSNVKKRKKQARRRSSSREDKRDLSRTKKRKRSKKNGDSKSRKNSRRKKLRRDVEISSASSASRSCSTCNGGSISESERSEDERVSRRRSKVNKKDTRDLHKGKVGSTLSTRRSPGHSSYGRYQDESCSVSQSEEAFMIENKSRRLRSVIVVAEKPEPRIREENELENDMQKEELVYDRDDCPCKSSSGEGSKKLSTPCPPSAFDGVQRVENAGFISEHGVTRWSENGNDLPHQYHVRDPSSDEFEKNNSIPESRCNIPLPDSGSSGNDLEAILKQKALENLKKFRGALKTNIKPTAYQKDKDKVDLNGSSGSKAEIVQSELPKQAGSTQVERDIADGGYTGEVPGTAKQNPDDPPDGLAHSGNPNEEGPPIRHTVLDKSAMGRNSSFRETSSGMDSTLKQTTSLVVSADKGLVESEKRLRKTDPDIAQSMSPSINTNQGTACSSALVEPAAAEKQSLNNQPDEAKDGSQYQQKTMSVMRGGEMVQVNYKVYIPKRTPALARRQLKR